MPFKLSFRRKKKGAREEGQQQRRSSTSSSAPTSTERDNGFVNKDNEESTASQHTHHAVGKKGIMRNKFSFRRTTSTTQFQPVSKQPPANDNALTPTLLIGSATDMGSGHRKNEDKATIIPDLFKEFPPSHKKKYNGTADRVLSVFCVFDGHGGWEASEWAQRTLHQYLSDLLWTSNFDEAIPGALHHSFKAVENEFCAWAKRKNNTAGSCATCVVIKGDKVFCGNAGDSKAMVLLPQSKHRVERVELNERHGYELKSERQRILRAGGSFRDGAVYGVLYPTRGFGDIDVKSDRKNVVICTPNGAGIDGHPPVSLPLDLKSKLILATDGLWDFATNDQVQALMLREEPQKCSEELIHLARRGGSEDDITVITINITFPAADELEPVPE